MKVGLVIFYATVTSLCAVLSDEFERLVGGSSLKICYNRHGYAMQFTILLVVWHCAMLISTFSNKPLPLPLRGLRPFHNNKLICTISLLKTLIGVQLTIRRQTSVLF